MEVVSKFTYLGIVFTTGGSFAEATNTLSGQATKAVFQLNKYLYKFVDIPVKHILDLFDKLIVPILNYGSEVWGFTKANNIERVQLCFCKKLLGVKQCTQNDFVYGELGRSSMLVRRYYIIIKYWLKLCSSSDIKYNKLVYELLVHDVQQYPAKANWASRVRDLISSLGLGYAWIQQGVGDPDIFLSLVKQRLTDQFIQKLA